MWHSLHTDTTTRNNRSRARHSSRVTAGQAEATAERRFGELERLLEEVSSERDGLRREVEATSEALAERTRSLEVGGGGGGGFGGGGGGVDVVCVCA